MRLYGKQFIASAAALIVLIWSPAPAAAGKGGWFHPVSGAKISQCYSSGHRAIDMYRGHRHRVRAGHSGKVVYAGWNDGYGRLVVIWHVGRKYTAYGHLDSISVRNQQYVKAGQTIGRQGQTGDATGSHLHYELWNGGWYRKVNPAPFMRARGVRFGQCR